MVPEDIDTGALYDELKATRAHVARLQEGLSRITSALLQVCEAVDLQRQAIATCMDRLDDLEG